MEWKCLICGGEVPYETEYCCDGIDCGCYGRPIHPPICNDECNEEWNRRSREDIVKFLKERNNNAS